MWFFFFLNALNWKFLKAAVVGKAFFITVQKAKSSVSLWIMVINLTHLVSLSGVSDRKGLLALVLVFNPNAEGTEDWPIFEKLSQLPWINFLNMLKNNTALTVWQYVLFNIVPALRSQVNSCPFVLECYKSCLSSSGGMLPRKLWYCLAHKFIIKVWFYAVKSHFGDWRKNMHIW